MADRRFIGPNGARFAWTEPLPGWLERMIERGEVTPDTPEARKRPKQVTGHPVGTRKATTKLG